MQPLRPVRRSLVSRCRCVVRVLVGAGGLPLRSRRRCFDTCVSRSVNRLASIPDCRFFKFDLVKLTCRFSLRSGASLLGYRRFRPLVLPFAVLGLVSSIMNYAWTCSPPGVEASKSACFQSSLLALSYLPFVSGAVLSTRRLRRSFLGRRICGGVRRGRVLPLVADHHRRDVDR